jgi:DNA mismatch repair ATPase MutS
MGTELSVVILIITSLIVFAASSAIRAVKNNNKLRATLAGQWGKEPQGKYKSEDIRAISGYYNNLKNTENNTFFIDDITWNDLDMDRVFMRINNTQSSVGEEYLYAMLRQPLFDKKVLWERERLIKFFQNNPEQRAKMQFILAKLGKKRGINISDYLYSEYKRNRWKELCYRFLSLAAVLSPVLIVFNAQAGIALTVIFFMTNMFVYYRAKNEISAQLEALSNIIGIVNCSKKIADSGIEELKEYNGILEKGLRNAKRMNKKTFSLFYVSGDPLTEYFKIALLKELIDFESLSSMINKYKEDLKNLYEVMGFFDALISVASYRESLPYYTSPVLTEFSGREKNLDFKDAYHPLIKEPVPNSFNIKKSALITGSNASGKSTFLKTVAINAILAQTVYTCLSREYSSCCFMVFSSMALKDSIQNNESYYIAEIKSLKRILDSLNSETPCLCVIDEVLRGTNTIERISASSQVLKFLSDNNCISVTATHDIELTHILEDYYENYHFQEKISDSEVVFDYKIYEGRSTSRNAIKLLKLLGYSNLIVDQAEERARNFAGKGKWGKL